MKSKCCRALPRCASCPARLAVPRRHKDLVSEVLAGQTPRELPPCVLSALEELDRSRRDGQAVTASSSA